MIDAQIRAPNRAGVYFWRRGTVRGGALVVNAEVVESDLSRLTQASFSAKFSGAPVSVLGDASRWTATVFAVTGRRALEGTFLLLALLLLAAEAAVTRAVPEGDGD